MVCKSPTRQTDRQSHGTSPSPSLFPAALVLFFPTFPYYFPGRSRRGSRLEAHSTGIVNVLWVGGRSCDPGGSLCSSLQPLAGRRRKPWAWLDRSVLAGVSYDTSRENVLIHRGSKGKEHGQEGISHSFPGRPGWQKPSTRFAHRRLGSNCRQTRDSASAGRIDSDLSAWRL